MESIQFAREPLTDSLWSEALPLLREHWKEVAHFPDIELSPDRDAYAASEAAGIIRCFTARVAGEGRATSFSMSSGRGAATESGPLLDGPLAGYALYFVRPNPHYAQSLQAAQDVIYIAPSARGSTGYRFIAWCDEQLAAEGVQATYHHVKAAHNFGPILERQGYSLVDLIYTKRLDQPANNSLADSRSARATAEPSGLHALPRQTGTPHCASKGNADRPSSTGAGSTSEASPSRVPVAAGFDPATWDGE